MPEWFGDIDRRRRWAVAVSALTALSLTPASGVAARRVWQLTGLPTVYGHRLGWKLSGTEMPWDLSGWCVEIETRREWGHPR